MKNPLVLLFCITAFSFTQWQHDFEKAKQTAKEKHLLILLNFSGSDWCVPCIQMRKQVFENEQFIKMADSTLVLVNADFPRNKKNQADPAIKKQNEALADKYDPQGKFPFTLLLDADGKIIKTWEGLPTENVTRFSEQIKVISDARK